MSLIGDWINLYGELDSLISQTLVWSLLTSFLSLALLFLGQTLSWLMFSTMVACRAVCMKTLLGQGFRLLRGHWGLILRLFLLVDACIVVSVTFSIALMLLFSFVTSVTLPDTGANNVGTIIGVLLGSLVTLAIPAIIGSFFFIRFCLVMPAMVIENIGVFAALRRSWGLTRGHF